MAEGQTTGKVYVEGGPQRDPFLPHFLITVLQVSSNGASVSERVLDSIRYQELINLRSMKGLPFMASTLTPLYQTVWL